MASDRDTLAELLASRQRCCPSPGRAAADADAVLAAGWRPPARVIETAEQLASVTAPGTLLVDDWGSPWERGRMDVWYPLSGRRPDAPHRIVLPATVQWEPKAGDR
jgi:hypothetical protein